MITADCSTRYSFLECCGFVTGKEIKIGPKLKDYYIIEEQNIV